MAKCIPSIPKEIFNREYRRLSRSIAAELLKIMAETDISFAEIAIRMDCSERKIRMWFKRMTDGTGNDLRMLCNIATAMDRRLVFEFQEIKNRSIV